MSNSREDSPDWLRSFQAPTRSILTLSSDSEASPKNSPLKDDTTDTKRDSAFNESQREENDEDNDKISSERSAKSASNKSTNKKTPQKRQKVEGAPAKRRKTKDTIKNTGNDVTSKSEEEPFEEQTEVKAQKDSIWTLSSDSESDAKLEEKDVDLLSNESEAKVALKVKSPKKIKKHEDHTPTNKKEKEKGKGTKGDLVDVHVADKTTSEKRVESSALSSMLPLVLPEKVQRTKALVECEGDSIDLSGDIGAVGRVIISDNPPGDGEMLLDLKGTIYRTTIVPSRTFCVVSVGPSEAKIEAIMNDFIQLKPQSNVYDAETMVEGTLDGFSFDSDDEAEKMSKAAASHQGDQNDGAEEQINEKSKAKSVKKPAGMQKKGKSAGGKQVKKKKPQAAKKGKGKK